MGLRVLLEFGVGTDDEQEAANIGWRIVHYLNPPFDDYEDEDPNPIEVVSGKVVRVD